MKLTKMGKYLIIISVFWVLLLTTLNVTRAFFVENPSKPQAKVEVPHDIGYYTLILRGVIDRSSDHPDYGERPKHITGMDEEKFKKLIKKHIPSEYTVVLKRDNSGYNKEGRWVCTMSKDTDSVALVW